MTEKFNVEGIPSLIVVSPSCEIINSDGVDEVYTGSKEALYQWSQGKRLFWSREAGEDEYTWKYTTCTQCYMNPLIGSRYSCAYQDCSVNLCETCLSKNQHEHPLFKCLIPIQHYSLEQLFQSVPYLLNPTNEEKIETKTMWEDNVKCVGFYFAAKHDPSCQNLTPKLAEIYKEIQTNSNDFRLVFVSCDKDETSFNEYRSTMPWPAVPFNSTGILRIYFQHYSKC